MRTSRTALFFLATAMAVGAGAQQRVNESRPAAATGVVSVESISGTITLTGWSTGKVEVQGTLGRGIDRLDIETVGERTRIKVVYPENCRDCEGADLDIRIPAGSRLEVETVSADISVDQVVGAIEFETVSGRVKVAGQPADVRVETVSGDAEIAVSRGNVEASTVSGHLTVREAGSEVRASTVSGTVRVEVPVVRRGEFSSVSGKVSVSSDVAPGGRIEAETVSGSVELVLPAEVSAEVRVETFSGRIDTDFGPAARSTSRYTPEKELAFVLGSGNARIEVESFSGDVTLRRR